MIHRILIGAALVALTTATSFGQTITETFNAGIPASWTIVDNHVLNPAIPDFSAVPWTTNDVELLGNYTNGTPSLAATASSWNHPGQYDISLITPTFRLTAGPDGRSIAYDVNYNRADAFEFFDTNLSVNGGPWVTMVHETSDEGANYSTGPPRVRIGIDLTFPAFGAAVGDLVRVEFRYYSTFLLPMVRNQYVQIDNVRIPEPVPVPEPATLVGFAAACGALGVGLRRRNAAVTTCLARYSLNATD